MAELLIVVSVVGILAAVSIPIFLEQKDRAITAVTRANLDAMRSALMQYSIGSAENTYPVGSLNYFEFRTALPAANLPLLEASGKILSGSFLYTSDGLRYLIRATSTNRTAARFKASAAGIVPDQP